MLYLINDSILNRKKSKNDNLFSKPFQEKRRHNTSNDKDNDKLVGSVVFFSALDSNI